MSPKRSSACRSWRTLFPSSDDAVTPSSPSPSPSPALMTLAQSQSASNPTNLLPSPQLNSKEMDDGKPSQQPPAGDLAPGIANSCSANDGVQEEKASTGDGVQEDEEEKEKACTDDGVLEEEEKEKASPNDGVQEEEEKEDLSASCPESNPLVVEKKKPAMAKEKKSTGRVWSLQDEFRILNCLAAYVKSHGEPPARALLCAVVRGHVLDKKDFTVIEIYEKVRRMRNRYYSMRQCRAADGAPPRGDADDVRKYELSQKIWGDSLPLPKLETKENVSGQATETRVRREFEELRRMYPHLTYLVEQIAVADRGCLKRAFQFIDDSKASELEARVKKQRISEMKAERDRSSARRDVLSMFVKHMT